MARETIEVANATQSAVSLPLHLATPHRFALVYTGIRVVDTCIVEDHFAKFHVLEAELHLLSKENSWFHKTGAYPLSSSETKNYDEVLRIDMQKRAVIPLYFCETRVVPVFVTRSHHSFTWSNLT